ncbi:FtsX-like permease family protein [Corynebacterium choanae]|uniref:FtsX-like permease family protein n=1 Tax=Corynebacterium choanae TaxID=1862358 RepID=A0A3G6J7W2_9CORY|nr:ABC transporter permease [Corynebacterium choanae]AZA12530.1 FtsX-like permease family protein [Corynebacterium choanae]
MLRFALGQLRYRAGRYLAVWFAIVAAVTLTTATADIAATVQHSLRDVFSRTYPAAGVTATVAGSREESAALLEQASQIPAVTAATFDEQVTAYFAPPGQPLATVRVMAISEGPLQWRRVLEGQLPTQPGEIATSSNSIPVGSTGELRGSNGQPLIPVTVVGRVERSGVEEFSGTDFLFGNPQLVADLAGSTARGELRAATTSPAAATDVAAAFTGGGLPAVEKAATNSAVAEKLTEKYLAKRERYFLLLRLFVVVVAATALAVIASAFGVIALGRTREFALLHTLGATAGQLHIAHAIESCVLAATAVLFGLPLGRWLGSQASDHANVIGVDFPLQFHAASPPVWAAIAVAVLVLTWVAGLPAMRNAMKQDPIAALFSTDDRPRLLPRLVALVVPGIVAIVLGWWWKHTIDGTLTGVNSTARRLVGSYGVIAPIGAATLLAAGVTLIASAIIVSLLATAGKLIPLRGLAVAKLTCAYIGRGIGRAAAMSAIMLLGCVLIAAVTAGQHVLKAAVVETAAVTHDVDVTLTGVGDPVPLPLVDTLRNDPGVEAVATPPMVQLRVQLPELSTTSTVDALVLGVDQADTLTRGHQTIADADVLIGRMSPLRDQLADGATVTAQLGDFTIFDLTTSYADIPFDVIQPRRVPEEITAAAQQLEANTGGVPIVLVRVAGEANQAADNPTLANIKAAVGTSPTPVSLLERFTARESITESAQRIVTIANLMTAVALLIAAVGVTNTVLLSVQQRRRDQALLHSIGLLHRQYVLSTLAETVLITAPAAIIGILSGAILGTWSAQAITFRQVVWTLPDDPSAVIGYIIVPILVAVFAAAVGILFTSRSTRPADYR